VSTETRQPFTSSPDQYERNVLDGRGSYALPAHITRPDGGIIPGAAIFIGGRLKGVLPAKHATALADQIIDALEEHNK
jgi:hypothetical protein